MSRVTEAIKRLTTSPAPPAEPIAPRGPVSVAEQPVALNDYPDEPSSADERDEVPPPRDESPDSKRSSS